MGLTLDELNENDEIIEKDSFKFLMSPEVLKMADSYGGIVIDYVNTFYSKGIKVFFRSIAYC